MQIAVFLIHGRILYLKESTFKKCQNSLVFGENRRQAFIFFKI